MQNLVKFGGLNETKVCNTLVYFGANEVRIFQGLKFGVTTQLMHKHVPFVSNVHFMAHCTNLAIQTFSGLTLVAKIEASNLVELLECKGNKILKTIT